MFRLMEKRGSSRRPFEESFHSEKWFAKTLQRLLRSLGKAVKLRIFDVVLSTANTHRGFNPKDARKKRHLKALRLKEDRTKLDKIWEW